SLAWHGAARPVARALAAVSAVARPAAAVRRWGRVVETRRHLASAGRLSGVFTPLESSLVRAAQEAGALAHIHEQLAQRYDEQARHAADLVSRLLLPAGVLVLALTVKPLPALIGGSLSVAGYLAAVVLPVLALCALLSGARLLWRCWQQRRTESPGQFDDLLLALPVLGSLQRRADLRNYCDSLGLLLEAGMPVLDALPRASSAMN